MDTKYIAEINGTEHLIEIVNDREVRINGIPHRISFQPLRQKLTYSLLVDGGSFETNIYQENGSWEVILRGRQYSVRVEDERERRMRLAAGELSPLKEKVSIEAPMPGLVIEISVQEGEPVQKGDVLLMLESMKMQNELTAPRDGIVSRINVSENQNVERKQTLLILE